MFNVLIRPLVVQDAFFSWEWRNDPDVWIFTGKKPNQYITHEIEKEWIEKVIKETTSRRFAILVNEVYIGNIQLTNIEENKRAEYHIFIGNKEYWSKGIGLLATIQIIRYAKTVLNLEEIYLFVHPDNISAIRLYEKCNFKKLTNDIKMSLGLLDKLIPKVSIFMMVYNHEKYIKDALDGILAQKCNFDFEIVVGEDNSSDESRNILREYSENFPGKFKLLLHETNIGAQKNQMLVFENCIGKYIALCEGDDYWTDPLKLQKQVDFLEANSDYVLCFHQVNILKLDGEIVEDFITTVPDDYETLESLATFGNHIHTPSVVFRNVIKEFPFEFQLSPIGDYFLYILLAEYGKIKWLNEKMAVYRFESGIYSKLEYAQKFKKWNRTLILILSYSSNDKVKLIFCNKLFESLRLNDDAVEIKQNKKLSLKKRFFKTTKLFIPPIFLLIKWKISSLRNASR